MSHNERPRSLWVLGALIALCLLQWFPPTGIFLMLVAAALWAGLLVHVFLLGLVYECLWLRRISKAWLVLPVFGYTGYYALYASEQSQLAARAAQLRATNSGLVVRYDPGKYSVSSDNAFVLAAGYAIPVVYTPHTYQAEGSSSAQQFESIRRIPKVNRLCPISLDNVETHTSVMYAFDTGVCILRKPENPQHSILRIAVRDVDGNWQSSRDKYHEQISELWLNGKRLGSYGTITVSPLPPIPLLFIGCALAGGPGPEWFCDADAIRSEQTLDTFPKGVDKSLYDGPESVMLGIRKIAQAQLTGVTLPRPHARRRGSSAP